MDQIEQADAYLHQANKLLAGDGPSAEDIAKALGLQTEAAIIYSTENVPQTAQFGDLEERAKDALVAATERTEGIDAELSPRNFHRHIGFRSKDPVIALGSRVMMQLMLTDNDSCEVSQTLLPYD